jgi:RNA-directed DNA polymerase
VNVRRITQDNRGKKTAGVDGITCLNPKERISRVKELLNLAKNNWKRYFAKPILRFYIPKKNGKLRPLGIPTIKDRAVQGIFKTALEPFRAAVCESGRYGFRPAHSAHDAIELIFKNLSKVDKWVLDADIKGCFDNISHKFLSEKLKDINPIDRKRVSQWLKSGVMDKQEFSRTNIGTPQGGIISPLLANIALDGMEGYLFNELKKEYKYHSSKGLIKGSKFAVIRYADDFVIIHKNEFEVSVFLRKTETSKVIRRAEELLIDWLAIRGLELSQEKTKRVHSTEGFDFLGFNCRHYDRSGSSYWVRKNEKCKIKDNNKCIIKPSKEAINRHYVAISDVIDQMKAARQDEVIKRLNPIITGWANYYRGWVAGKAFSKLDYLVWLKLRKWAIRRCGRKSASQNIQNNFHTIGRRKWCFATFKDGKPDKVLNRHVEVKTKRHVMVKSGQSFYDGDTVYWASRLSKGYGNISPSKAKLLKKQDGKCAYCNQLFKAEDLMESHHVKFKAKGGKDEYKNLVVMHRHCHDQYHSSVAIKLSRGGKFKGESDKIRF